MRIAVVVALPILLTSVACVRAEDVAKLIERQSQEFSDASASGDAATIAKYLDDRVIFMNETGEISDKKGIVDGTTADAQEHPAQAHAIGFQSRSARRRRGDVVHRQPRSSSFTDRR